MTEGVRAVSPDVPTQPGPASPNPLACLGPVATSRVNLLAQRRLSTAEARAALAAAIDAVHAMQEAAPSAQDALHELVGRSGREDRRRLLELRRRIHKGREIPERLGTPPVGQLWPMAVERWLIAERAFACARVQVESRTPHWIAEERWIVAGLLEDRDLRLALEMSAPLVAVAAERYVEHAGRWDVRDGKAERGLVQFVTRALVRTSPLGRFTAVGLATWKTGGGGLADVPDLATADSEMSYDRAMLVHSLGGLLVGAGSVVDGWVMVNATFEITEGRVEFVVGTDGRVNRRGIAISPVISALLALAGLGPLPSAVLVAELAAIFDRPLADAAKAVHHTLNSGLLTEVAFANEQDDDPLAIATARLEATASAGLVGELERRLAAVGGAGDPGARRLALRQLRELEEPLANATLRPARLHVNEDVQLRPTKIDPAGHRAALDELAAVLDFSSLYDPMHELRGLLTRAAVDLIGEGGERSLAACAHALVSTVYERWATLDARNAVTRGPADGALGVLLRVRRDVTAELLDEIGRAGPAESIVWDPARLRELGSRLPGRFRRAPEAYAVLVQPVDNSRLVLNALYSGHGSLFARFLGRDERRGGDALACQRSRLERRWGADGVPLAEDRGLHRLGVNSHEAILTRAIRASEWAGVRLRHDADRDELSLLDGEGMLVRPMALGTAWQEALPPTVRVAAWLTQSGRTPPDAIAEAWRRGRAPGTAATLPRLGTPRVVVSRRRWLTGEGFPGDGADADGSLMALARWRAAHDVAEEVVFKTPVPERLDTSDDALKDTFAERRREKPQYVDLASALHARLLPRLLRRRGDGFVEEALPGLLDGAHALEWVVEFERSPGQRFAARRPLTEDPA